MITLSKELTHTAEIYIRAQSIATPPGWDASPSHVAPWVERGTVRVKCLAQEHNTMTRPGLKPDLSIRSPER